MKKTMIYAALVITGIMFVSSTAHAQVVSTQGGGAGGTVTIPNTNGDGPDMAFNPSPSTLMAVTSSTNAFAITAMNNSASNGDRLEYGIWSGSTGYYQMVNPDPAGTEPVLTDLTVDLAANTDLTATPFGADTWIEIGGGGS